MAPALVQDERVKELLELVRERNPFQRARLSGLPEEPTLDEVPPLTKRELIEDQANHPPFGTNLTYPLRRYTQLHQTSGTTGRPLRVLDTAEDWAWWRELFGGMTSVQRLQTIADVRATAVMCAPTYALRLIEVALEERLEGALESVRQVICTGEPGASLPAVRSRIEEGFGARCFDHAGLTEAGPFGYPCPEGGGLHLYERDFACEILDSELRPTLPGERGELVVTPLRRTGFPVLRYRTGDVVVNAEERCPAGHEDRWLPGGIVGRTDDMVVIRGMNVYPSAIEEAVRGVSGSGEFRITFYTEPGGMDEIKLEVELPDGGAARRLQETMRQQLGLRVRVVPVTHGTLPRMDGKARRVVDARSARW